MNTYRQTSAGYGIITLRDYCVTHERAGENASLFTKSTETFHAHSIIGVSGVSRVKLL